MRGVRIWLRFVAVALAMMGTAAAKDTSRKVREPPPWTDQPLQPLPACPYAKDRRPEQHILVICKLALVGNVGNIAPVTPGLFDDYEDWPYLKSYWDTEKRFFFSANGCGYDTSESGAKFDAEQEARKNTLRLVNRWNGVLDAGIFRGLAFHKTDEQMVCARRAMPSDIAGKEPFDEREADEGDDTAVATRSDPDAVTFVARSDDPKNVSFATCRHDGTRVEPAPGRVWTLSTEPKRYRVSCVRGESVCWGAWRREDNTVTWGAGRGPLACKSCCAVCGSGEKQVHLDAGPDRPPPNKLVVTINSNSPYATDVRFYTGDRRKQYPAGDQVFTLAGNEEHSYTMTCEPGEQICYGAGVRSNYNSYWGVSVTGQQGCIGCCMTCGSGQHSFTLNGGDPTPPQASSGGGGSTVSAIMNGLAIGATIGSAFGGRGGGGTVYRAPSRPPITGSPQPYGGSDISGTR